MGYLIFYLISIIIMITLVVYQNANYIKRKAMIGSLLIPLSTLENYLWIPNILTLILPVINIVRIPKMQFYDVIDLHTEYITEIGMFIFLALLFYRSIQKTAIHQGGIKSSLGVWRWEDIVSFSLKREGPFQYEEFYNWISKPKYELTFEVWKNTKKKETIKMVWKVPEKFKDKIYEIITDKIPEKEKNVCQIEVVDS